MLGKDIENLVIVKLEEYTPFSHNSAEAGPILSGNDVLKEVKPIYSYVEQSLAEAADEILKAVPLNKVYPEIGHCAAHEDDTKTGHIHQPEDFLRLHTLRMQSWKRDVHVAYQVESPMWELQQNEFTRGSVTKPIVIYDAPFLRYYSVEPSEQHTIVKFLYVSKFDKHTDYMRETAEAIALNCAKKVLEVFGNTEQLNIITAELNSVMENMKL